MLALLFASPHRVWSREELARLVLRVPHTVQADGNVRVRAHNLRKKLGPLACQIRTVRSVGYRFVAQPGQPV